MKLCAVQIAALKGDLPGNLGRHLHCIELAVHQGAELVVFPELSLTGYEPTLARQLALPAESPLLNPLQALCERHAVTVAVGAPLLTAAGVQIGMLVFRPGLPRLGYAKQRLHADELPYFVAGEEQARVFASARHCIAPAICYESMFMEHAEQAKKLDASLYLVSVAKTAKGIKEGFEHYPEVARRLALPVLMANCVGPADTFVGAGQSAAWDSQGRLLAALDEHNEGLLLLDTCAASARAVHLADLA